MGEEWTRACACWDAWVDPRCLIKGWSSLLMFERQCLHALPPCAGALDLEEEPILLRGLYFSLQLIHHYDRWHMCL